jgi:hypothetical protein
VIEPHIHRTVEQSVRVKVASEDEAARHSPNPEVVKMALLLRASHAREDAIQAADRGDFRSATNTLTRAADEIEKAGLDDDDLQSEHDLLREDAMDMELGPERYDAHVRKVGTARFSDHDLPEWRSGTRALHDRMK